MQYERNVFCVSWQASLWGAWPASARPAPESCENELLLPLAPLDRSAFAVAVDRIQSVNLARTSIAATLREAARDLAGDAGSRHIVLITDGEETCGGDPLAEINRLREEGFEVRLNIVGFAIDDPDTRRLFGQWAAAGAGEYFDAGDREALGAAIREATALHYEVLNSAGAQVAQGVVGGEPVTLPPGSYAVRFGAAGAERAIVVRAGETATLVLDGR